LLSGRDPLTFLSIRSANFAPADSRNWIASSKIKVKSQAAAITSEILQLLVATSVQHRGLRYGTFRQISLKHR
jgi:hypothetical protein